MIRRHLMTLRMLFILADGVLALGVFLAVSVVRFEADPTVQWSVAVDPLFAGLAFAVLWMSAFWSLGYYRLQARWSLLADARDVVRGTVVVLVVALSLLFLFHQEDVSRLFLAMLFVVQPTVAFAGRLLLRRWFEARRQHGRDTNYMLVVGAGPSAEAFADRVESHPSLGIRVIGHLSADDRVPSVSRAVMGSVHDMHAVLHSTIVDDVAVCLEPEAAHFLDPVVTVATEEGKTVRVPRALDEGILRSALTEEFDGYLVHSIVHDGQREVERALKRTIDVVGAFVALVVLSPLVAATAIAIRLRDGAPILFRQTRVGLHGRPFTIYKFRTMDVGAEERRSELAHRNEVTGPAFKLSDDPRATPLGRRLRAWSLDELPQLVNVLNGDMSLVGPRPALPSEVAEYDIWHRRRLSVRPGITGLWQIEARSDGIFDNRAALDLRYIDQWSIWTDARILARTIPAVFFSRGR